MDDGSILLKLRSFTRTKNSGLPNYCEIGTKTEGFHETLESEDGSYYDSGVRIYFSVHTGWLLVSGKHLPRRTLSSRSGVQSSRTLLGYNLSKVTWKSITDNVARRVDEVCVENIGQRKRLN